jgi:hypothetical protein
MQFAYVMDKNSFEGRWIDAPYEYDAVNGNYIDLDNEN